MRGFRREAGTADGGGVFTNRETVPCRGSQSGKNSAHMSLITACWGSSKRSLGSVVLSEAATKTRASVCCGFPPWLVTFWGTSRQGQRLLLCLFFKVCHWLRRGSWWFFLFLSVQQELGSKTLNVGLEIYWMKCVSLHVLRQPTFSFEAFLSRGKVCVPVIKALRAPKVSLCIINRWVKSRAWFSLWKEVINLRKY